MHLESFIFGKGFRISLAEASYKVQRIWKYMKSFCKPRESFVFHYSAFVSIYSS
jgi:hypothetical protein